MILIKNLLKIIEPQIFIKLGQDLEQWEKTTRKYLILYHIDHVKFLDWKLLCNTLVF